VGHTSTPSFRCFHALRIKGFASAETVAEVAGVSAREAETHLADLLAREWAVFRENRGWWQLNPVGKDEHKLALQVDVPSPVAGALSRDYRSFLTLNDQFKIVCTDWQLRDGDPNDHLDEEYDTEITDRLAVLHETAKPVVVSMASILDRLSPYPERLNAALGRLYAGNLKMLTGVMCNSYHDVWMELHEDLLLTQGIDRRSEGSF
jgi:hypothetical protein